MKTYMINGTYGSSKTPCFVFVMETASGLKWYAVEGSWIVNATYDDVEHDVDVEELNDVDTFTWKRGIDSEEDLETAVNA